MQLIAVLGLLGALAAPCAASATTGTAWWHLISGARPGNLHAGVASNDVQELTVVGTGGEVLLADPLRYEEVLFTGRRPELAELLPAIIPFDASVEVVQKGLETAFPGRKVLVEAGEKADTAESHSWKITFPGQTVKPLATEDGFIETSFGGTPLSGPNHAVTVKQLAQGRPDGQIVLMASNLGDAGASTCVAVTAGTGKFKNSSCTEAAEPGAEEFEREGPPIVIADQLPAGLRAVSVEAVAGAEGTGGEAKGLPVDCALGSLTCTLSKGSLPAYDQIEVRVGVEVAGAESGKRNHATVSGGGGPSSSVSRPITVSDAETSFGVDQYELTNEEAGGAADTQAGSHPFQQTTTLDFKQTAAGQPAALPKDLSFRWPAGLIGNPQSIPRCSLGQFLTIFEGELDQCPAKTAVGVALISVNEPKKLPGPTGLTTFQIPVFNVEPSLGEPARFGFYILNTPVFIDPSVRVGEDYGITVHTDNISQTAAFLSAEVTVWGVPGDPRHDAQRGWDCLAQAHGLTPQRPCTALAEEHPPSFLSLPTSCPGHSLATSVQADSWADPSTVLPFTGEPMPALDGCNRLPFQPSLTVAPDGQEASKPSGLTVDVHVPQEQSLSGTGLSEASVKDTTVTLPEGVAINPAGADGLDACSESLIGGVGFTGFQELDPIAAPHSNTAQFTPTISSPFCPAASKIGTARITLPILKKPLVGAVYLASQNANPFGSLVAMYIVAEDPESGVLLKLPGEVSLNPATGQITSTFLNTPQAPAEDIELHFFGGERAPLSTPAHCGTYTTTTSITPWSLEAGGHPATPSSAFEVKTGPNGSPCPGASLPFSPSLAAGSPNINAGAFSPLDTTIGREDGNQNIQTVQLHMAPGMSGILAGVPLCPEAQANEGICGAASLIGETTVSAGVGNDPVSVKGGKIYLTEKYAGAPFGLSIVNPVKTGPFDLEHDTNNPANQPPCDCVVVRAKIEINPTTAALTITTDPSGPHAIPHLIDGVPVQIKAVNVTVNRPGFTFNPTNCNPSSITGSIGSDESLTSPVSVPFQVTNCAALKYTPTLTVSTAGKASRANGASLFFKIAYPKGAVGSQSWMKEMKFVIPKQLPSRLTTLQKACLAHVFEVERQNCPAASIIGHVLVHTPVLPVPLEGPLYFVSYGGAAFPDAVAVIQGDGITIESHGHTLISKGVTSATFESVPDVPFESIEVTVPQGKFSEFGANLPKGSYDFCGQKLTMPTLFKAQNGAEIHQNTAVGVTGCPPSVSITKTAVKGNSVAVTVKLGQQGTVKISGKGLRTTTKRGLKAGTRTITVPLTAVGRAAKRHGRKLKVQASLTVSGRTGTATTTLKA